MMQDLYRLTSVLHILFHRVEIQRIAPRNEIGEQPDDDKHSDNVEADIKEPDQVFSKICRYVHGIFEASLYS